MNVHTLQGGSTARLVRRRSVRSGLRRALSCVVVLVFLSYLFPAIALAHALLERSDPPADALLRTSPAIVHLWFTEDLNGAASRIVVWDRYRHVMNLGNAKLVPGQPRQMEVTLKPLPPGSYLVLWTSVSAQDGHLLRGSYLFSVKIRGPGPSLAGVPQGGSGQSFPDSVLTGSLLAHWIELLAAVTWAGTAVVSAYLLGRAHEDFEPEVPQRERLRRGTLLKTSVAALILSSGVVLLLQAYGLAGNDWGAVFTSSTLSALFDAQYGKLWIAREALALVSLVLVFRLSWSGVRSAGSVIGPLRAPRGLTAVPGDSTTVSGIDATRVVAALGLVYLYLLAASGHAASAAIAALPGNSLISGSVFLDWLHLLGTALWFGGQIYFALALIPAVKSRIDSNSSYSAFLRVLNRFSPIAYGSIAIFTVTGAFNGVIHIPSWYAYFHSAYGWALTVKIGFVGLMMLTSMYTVYWLRPHIREGLAAAASAVPPHTATLQRSLLRWLNVNPALGLAVLLATSVMFYYPVPVGLSPAGPSSYSVRASGLAATVTLKPDKSGPNQVLVTLRDSKGRLVKLAHVAVLTTMLDMQMGTGLVALEQTGPGQFLGSGDLGMGGHWRLQLLVYLPNGTLTRMNVRVQVGT